MAHGLLSNWASGMANQGLTGLTDWLGITDSTAGERGAETLRDEMKTTNAQLDQSMQPVYDMYQKAQQGREMGDVLDNYTAQMSGTENAASEDNVRNFMNPMYGRAMANATNGAMAGAGSSLQSSANANAVASAVSDQSQQMWQQAFQNAMSDATNKQNVYNQNMNANLMPSLNWAQLTSDIAGTRYSANAGVAQSLGQAAGQSQGLFSNLL